MKQTFEALPDLSAEDASSRVEAVRQYFILMDSEPRKNDPEVIANCDLNLIWMICYGFATVTDGKVALTPTGQALK